MPRGEWSDREIARRCAVSNQFVSNIRPSVNDGQMERKVERSGSTSTMNTSAIGKAARSANASRSCLLRCGTRLTDRFF
jgi:hypothetical protein